MKTISFPMTVMGADDPKQKIIGWTCYETLGTSNYKKYYYINF